MPRVDFPNAVRFDTCHLRHLGLMCRRNSLVTGAEEVGFRERLERGNGGFRCRRYKCTGYEKHQHKWVMVGPIADQGQIAGTTEAETDTYSRDWGFSFAAHFSASAGERSL